MEDLRLIVLSDYPAVQIYSTNYPPEVTLLEGTKVIKYGGLAIEPADIVCGQNGDLKTWNYVQVKFISAVLNILLNYFNMSAITTITSEE